MKKRTLTQILIICSLILIICLVVYGIILSIEKSKPIDNIPVQPVFKEPEIDNSVYIDCMNTSYYGENTKVLIQEFLTEYQNENIGLYFKDEKNNYTITKNETSSFYGASLIKILDATYLIRRAMKEEINLDDLLTYEYKHKSDYSLGLENYNIGDKIPIRELIKFAITYSDNTAHAMLYDYIGVMNLKSYASSLGINLTINEKEHFGNLTANDAYLMVKEAFSIIELNNKYSELLKLSMDNDYYNSLNFESVRLLHKYGQHASFYNEIGIFDSDSPYLIAVLTPYGYIDYEQKVKIISKKIYQIYSENLVEKVNYCKKLQEESINKKSSVDN